MKDKDGAALTALFAAASQSPLKSDQFTFLEEWKEVMQHVASGLDFLQGDDGMFLGYMLPTIQMMKEQLEKTKEKVTMCKPLADAALRGIRKRFDAYFTVKEMLVASAYLPECKVDCLSEESKHLAKQYLVEAAREEGPEVTAGQEECQKKGYFAKRP